MKLRTFAFWRNASYPGQPAPPLVVNAGLPSEARLIARGDKVFIYAYTGLDHPDLGGLPPSRPAIEASHRAEKFRWREKRRTSTKRLAK